MASETFANNTSANSSSFYDGNKTFAQTFFTNDPNSTSNVSIIEEHGSMSVDMYANTYLVDHPTVLLLFAVSLSIASVCGVLGNIMVIYAVMTDKFLRQPANLLVINVAIADIFIAGLFNPFNVLAAVYGYEVFARRPWLCVVLGSMCVPVCTSSLYNLALIAVSRCIHICKFNWYSYIYTWNKTFLMCISVWIFGFLLHLPNHIGWGHSDYGALFFICTSDVGVFSYSMLWLSVGIFLPFFIVALSYLQIFWVLCQRNQRNHQIEASPANSQQALFPSTTNSNATDIVMVQRRPPENFVVRNAIISDNNLDTVDKTPYHKQSYPTMTADKLRTSHVAALVAAAKQKKSRTIVLSYNRPNRTFKSVQDEIKLIRTMFITVVAFAAGWSLFIVLVLMRTPDWMPKWVYVLSIFLAHIQSAVNPIIYCLTNVHFRNAYKMKIFPSNS